MKKQTTKAITFTPIMRAKGLAAFTSGVKAESDKAVFFKAIKPRVSSEQIAQAFGEFKGIAIEYYAEAHGLGDALIAELANPTLKNAAKMKGCKLTMKHLKKGIDTMARRWQAAYRGFLKTGVVDKRTAPAKRVTKGAVKPKQVDKVELNQAPDITPLKAAIQYVTTIPRTVLHGTKPSQCSEGLRQEIEIATLQLIELLSKIK